MGQVYLSVMTRQIRSPTIRMGSVCENDVSYRRSTKVSIMETKETMGLTTDEISIKTETKRSRRRRSIVLIVCPV